MSDQLFQTDLFTTDQGNGCTVCGGHDHLTADCPHGQAMTLELADHRHEYQSRRDQTVTGGVRLTCATCGHDPSKRVASQ